jgi:hypothetical protein
MAALRGFKGVLMPPTKPRRRLGDLYVRGEEINVDDGSGAPVKAWIQKLNELERDAVLRRSSAKKARFELEAEHQESEQFVATLGSLREFVDHEGLISIAIAEDMLRFRQRTEAQMTEDEDGWGKDNKITELIDEWTGSTDSPGLAAAYAEDENDPNALRVKGEIEAFEADLERAVTAERDRLVAEWESASEADLARKAARDVLKRRAGEEFIREWNRQQVFYAVREPDDHHRRYFGTLQEVDDLDDRIRELLESKCNQLFMDNQEGKDSPATPALSISSESTPEISKRSGPVAVAL